MTQPRYIAMWSGPRNISTAMMRAWENRADTIVHDEPFYAHYLANSEYDHPGKERIIATYETDWQVVVAQLTGTLPDGKQIYYQKHMTHHMLPHIALDWVQSVTNCFLIREPRRVLNSFAKVVPNPTIEQTGLPQQIAIFDYVREQTGIIPPVLSARDVLTDPHRALSALCEAINLPFDEAMLTWPAGRRASDGIWAEYWYERVEHSTSFMPYQVDDRPVPDHLRDVLEACDVLYQQMARYCLLVQ
ncbi:MAG: HAD family hydrolase [Anaerolineae bacterium]